MPLVHSKTYPSDQAPHSSVTKIYIKKNFFKLSNLLTYEISKFMSRHVSTENEVNLHLQPFEMFCLIWWYFAITCMFSFEDVG